MFYARNQGAKSLEEIEHLILPGRGITYLKDLALFDRLTSLKRLDITDHIELFMCQEKKEALEFQATIGINKEQKTGVTFVGQNLSIHDVLPKLKSVEELVCDEDLEEYLTENRIKLGLMPNLRTINGVQVDTTDMAARKKEHQLNNLFKKLSKFAN
jgi:hypothetical protein